MSTLLTNTVQANMTYGVFSVMSELAVGAERLGPPVLMKEMAPRPGKQVATETVTTWRPTAIVDSSDAHVTKVKVRCLILQTLENRWRNVRRDDAER